MSRIEIYDTTLRDGAQGVGISYSVSDKLRITEHLDELGVSVIEGGWPGANPTDTQYFQAVRSLPLRSASIDAFGATRRPHVKPADDPQLSALVDAGTPIVTVVGKTWDRQVADVIRRRDRDDDRSNAGRRPGHGAQDRGSRAVDHAAGLHACERSGPRRCVRGGDEGHTGRQNLSSGDVQRRIQIAEALRKDELRPLADHVLHNSFRVGAFRHLLRFQKFDAGNVGLHVEQAFVHGLVVAVIVDGSDVERADSERRRLSRSGRRHDDDSNRHR